MNTVPRRWDIFCRVIDNFGDAGVAWRLARRFNELGERVRLWNVGDEVMSITGGGAYAERITMHERQLMRVPQRVGLADAAAIPEVYLTAWDALVVQGGLTSGRWALVHAGASGVGTAGIQIAKAIGANIAVTCSGGKVAAVKALGADVVIDYNAQDFVEETKRVTGGRGVDVILDVIGGDYANRNMDGVDFLKNLPANQGVQLGVLDIRTNAIEKPEQIAARVREALKHVPADKITLSSDCGMKPLARMVAKMKLKALTDGAAIVRKEIETNSKIAKAANIRVE